MKLTAALLLTSALALAETPVSFTATADNVAGAPIPSASKNWNVWSSGWAASGARIRTSR